MSNETEQNKPFPFFPPMPTMNFKIRMELMNDLNKWENNDPKIAKDIAKSIIEVIAEQFEIKVATT